MKAEDECPNCQSGTVEEVGDEFRCRGECGQIFFVVKVAIEARVVIGRSKETVEDLKERIDRLLAFGSIKDAFDAADIDLQLIQVMP